MDVERMKALLGSVKEVAFTLHFDSSDVARRGIGREDAERALRDPDGLVSVDDQGGDLRGHKYALLFEKSSRYDLRVVVSILGGRINVITTHVQNRKRRKVNEKCLKALE